MHISQLRETVVHGTKQRSREWWAASKEGLKENWGSLTAGFIAVCLAFLALANFPWLAGNTEDAPFGAWLIAWGLLGFWAMDVVVRLFTSGWPDYKLGEVINSLLRTAVAFVVFCMIVYYLGNVSLDQGMTREMNGAVFCFGAIIAFVPVVLVESRRARRRHDRHLLQKKHAELQRQFDDLADYVRRLD